MVDQNVTQLDEWVDPPEDYNSMYITDGEDDYYIKGETLKSIPTFVRNSNLSMDIGNRQIVFDNATDVLVTLNGTPRNGMEIWGYAIQWAGATSHKILLPENVYFGHTGTNRAANFTDAEHYIVTRCANIGGTFRFLIYGINGVTFTAS